MRAAIIYIRLTDSSSLLRDLAACLSAALTVGARPVAFYAENETDLSALQAAIEHTERARPAYLIVSALQHLSESERARIEAAGVRILPADPAAPVDPTIRESLSLLLDREHAARKAKMVQSQTDTRRKMIEGGILPAGRVPYGYRVVTRADVLAGRRPERDIATVEVDECEAGVARFIFEHYIQCRSTTEVAQDLSGRGAPTPSGRGSWSAATAARILLNPAYVGRLEWGLTPYVTAEPYEVKIGFRDVREPSEAQLAAMLTLLTAGARDLAQESHFNLEFNPKPP